MATIFYPATLYPADESGIWGVEVHGLNVNASGDSAQSALEDATAIAQEVMDDFAVTDTAVIPAPANIEELDQSAGNVALIPVNLSSKTVRLNVTLPDNIVERIDAVAPNRSGFLAEAALQRLRGL